jgi:glycolate oxidase FAD binding subunit
MGTAVQTHVNWAELAGMVGAENVRATAADDAIDGVQPQRIVEPASSEEVAKILQWATQSGIAVVPRGGGTKLGWGNPPARADLILSMRHMNRVLEHAWADLTVTVESGCTVQQLQQTLAQHGQVLALDPLWPERATIGGILATNDSGSLRVRFGALRDLIIGITVVLTDGTIARSGGKVVKNVAGYDLQKLMTGALGTLGVITEAVFRLYPAPREARTLSFRVKDFADAQRLLIAIQDATLEHTGLQARVAPDGIHLDVRIAGTRSGLETRTERAKALAANAQMENAGDDVWMARQGLWEPRDSALTQTTICKFSLLPTNLATFFEQVQQECAAQTVQWRLVAQATGLGNLRLQGDGLRPVASVVSRLRSAAESGGGALVLLDASRELKNVFDVWGKNGDTFPLMLRVKQQFDPAGVLNPGRFIGGI